MLDLFSGLGGASQAMREDDNWGVTTVDVEERFDPDICEDILELTPEDFDEEYNLIWASPPCQTFSCQAMGWYWNEFPVPKRKIVADRIKIVYYTLWLIGEIGSRYWFLENPTGHLRNIIGKPEGRITLCQFGLENMKPTDLWGEHPDSFEYKSCSNGDSCHVSAPKGSYRGTQHNDSDLSEVGKKAKKSKMPYGLSKAVKQSVESPESRNRLEAFVNAE
jgi:hypothetical protein